MGYKQVKSCWLMNALFAQPPRRDHSFHWFPPSPPRGSLCLPALALLLTALALPAAEPAAVLKQIGVRKGICALPGDTGATLAIGLAKQSELICYVQLANPGEVEAARRAADKAGLYGTRVYVAQGPLDRLHLADNLTDAVIATGAAQTMPEAEALRVAHPQAKVLLGRKTLTKPIPPGVDDWSHPYHSPDNNPVSRDQVARGPYLTQFLADPRYAPLPQVAVAAVGRVFKAFGHIAFKEREEPWLNTLAAFNGYNGTLLWRVDIAPALMVHRSTLIATADKVYFGDDKSCKVYAAATGALLEEIAPSASETGGTFWKWMALEGDTLYAMIGGEERRDPVIKAKSTSHGWPWNPLSPGFNSPENPWGYGHTLVAINLKTKRIVWRNQEKERMDGRAICLKNGRVYVFGFGHYLTCLDAETGSQIWRHTRESEPELFEALGEYQNRQDWRTNWRTTALMRCGEKALYFAGPAMPRLVAVSTETGKLMWTHSYSNYQLILHDNALYGISGQIDQEVSRKFDPLTGKVLAELRLNRRACTRPTAACDAIFFRAGEGSVRLDTAKDVQGLVSPMRPNCHDGVTVANGLLYWWPSVCDCNLTLYGITCLGPARDFDFNQQATSPAERLQDRRRAARTRQPPVQVDNNDWPVFRADNFGSVRSLAVVPEQTRVLWTYSSPAAITPTAPTAAGSLVFLGGSDGIVRALEAATGKLAWSDYTEGEIRLPPTLADGKAYVGSGDGWVYAWETSGAPLWRFRAAPVERRIPVYGTLQSTWPAASGVLVDTGTAYVAAGLANFDGTHVYALDSATGAIKWQNNTSGHLDPVSHTGVGVQGHMLIHDGKLFLAGGNAVSPAIYDLATGKCLNELNPQSRANAQNLIGSFSPRGWELYRVADSIRVAGKPYYAHPKYPVFDDQVLRKTLYVTSGGFDLAWINNAKLMCFADLGDRRAEFQRANWGKTDIQRPQAKWSLPFKDSSALAVAPNAAVITTPTEITAVRLADGAVLWKHSLPAPPVPWGLAINRDGKVFVTLEGGTVICFG